MAVKKVFPCGCTETVVIAHRVDNGRPIELFFRTFCGKEHWERNEEYCAELRRRDGRRREAEAN